MRLALDSARPARGRAFGRSGAWDVFDSAGIDVEYVAVEEQDCASIDRHTSELQELDVAGILAFAERVLPRAADLWVQASLAQRQSGSNNCSFLMESRSTETPLFEPL